MASLSRAAGMCCTPALSYGATALTFSMLATVEGSDRLPSPGTSLRQPLLIPREGRSINPSRRPVGPGRRTSSSGCPQNIQRGIAGVGWGQRSTVFAGYVQDDWRVTNNLTLNLGLRYEAHTPWVEQNNKQTNYGLFTGDIELAGQNGNSRALYKAQYGPVDFQPRVGFAWTPGVLGRKTVLRGAYTVSSYLEGTGTNLRLPLNPPFTSPEFETDYHDSNLPATTTEQGLLPPTDPFQNALIRLWDPDIQPAISQQWNLSMQHQFTNSTTLQVGYVGQHGTHLMVPMPYLQKQLHADGTITPSPFLSGNPTLQSKLSQISG